MTFAKRYVCCALQWLIIVIMGAPSERNVPRKDSSGKLMSDAAAGNALMDELAGSNDVEICGLTMEKNTFTLLLLASLFILLLLIGGAVFRAIEFPHQAVILEEKTEKYFRDKQAILDLLLNYNNEKDMEDALALYSSLQQHLEGFNTDPYLENDWVFAKSIIFCFTIVTTIGYGTFAPATMGGQMFLIAYALIGIPLTGLSLGFIAERTLYVFTWISKLGKDKVLDAFNQFDTDGSGELDKDEFEAAVKMLGFQLTPNKFTSLWNAVDSDGGGEVTIEEFRSAIDMMNADVTEASGQKNKIYITVAAIFFWISLGVLVFSLAEKWRPDQALYFLFVSLTTVGLGDFFPKTPFGLVFLVLFSMVGLGLATVLLKLIETSMSEVDNKHKKAMKIAQEKEEIRMHLKQIPFFSSFSEEDLDTLMEKIQTKEFGPNEEVIKEGSSMEIVYILLTGRVNIQKTNSEKIEAISAPSIIFDSPVINNYNSNRAEATVVTADESAFISVHRYDWEELRENSSAGRSDGTLSSVKEIQFTTQIILDEDARRVVLNDLEANKRRTATFVW